MYAMTAYCWVREQMNQQEWEEIVTEKKGDNYTPVEQMLFALLMQSAGALRIKESIQTACTDVVITNTTLTRALLTLSSNLAERRS